jgi:hypothetical protein
MALPEAIFAQRHGLHIAFDLVGPVETPLQHVAKIDLDTAAKQRALRQARLVHGRIPAQPDLAVFRLDIALEEIEGGA